MILKGNQRGHARNLAQHLLNVAENDHVEVYQLRDVAADDLQSAFLEIEATGYATPRGTAKSFYSLSVNPPADETADIADFERAIDMAEDRLGLHDQPRAIVFHEKYGRRHAHVVWSRIDTKDDMPVSIRISHDRQKLMELSHELFVRQGWDVPAGIARYDNASPQDIRHGEWMQFKRTGIHPDEHRGLVREAYDLSDTVDAFAHALEERGYILAQGNRGFVVLDGAGEVHSVMRLTKERKKAVEDKLGPSDQVQSVDDAQKSLDARRSAVIDQEWDRLQAERDHALEPYKRALDGLRAEQRAERIVQRQHHNQREEEEGLIRAQRLRSGLLGVWDRITFQHNKTVRRNAQEAEAAYKRDRSERQALIERQLQDRRALQDRMQIVLNEQMERQRQFRQEAAFYLRQDQRDAPRPGQGRHLPDFDGPELEPEL